MRRVSLPLLIALSVFIIVRAVSAADTATAETPGPGIGELDPFESPEAYAELAAALAGNEDEIADEDRDHSRHSAGDGDTSAASNDEQTASDQTDSAAVDPESEESEESRESDEAREDEGNGSSDDEPAPAARPPKTLTPQMQRSRDRVRYTLREHMTEDFSVHSSTATDVLYYCLGFGTKAAVRTANSSRPVSGLGCLCYNYSFRGSRPLTLIDQLPAGRVGYGMEAYPSQLFATLARANVKETYPIRVGKVQATVADLVEYEMHSCQTDRDMSLKLIGLAHYAGTGSEWVNAADETWTVDRIIHAEMNKPFLEAKCGGLHRLMGLSYAVRQRVDENQPIDGGYERARKYLDMFHNHALKLQNPDGSWHPKFFRVRGASQDTVGKFRSTGMIAEWLAYSLPEEQLDDSRMLATIDYLTRLLNSPRYRHRTPELPAREIATVMHAIHALRIYDARAFAPADPPAGSEEVAKKDGATTSG